LFLVLSLYDCKEASKIDWKLEDDEEAMEETRVMNKMMNEQDDERVMSTMSGHAVLALPRQ
jgi:hypothetical protein